jgi:hypothetical protein
VDNQNPPNKIPTPLGITFWTTPRSGLALMSDQIRLFFCDNSDQLLAWSFDAKPKPDDRKKIEAVLDEKAKPIMSKSSSFGTGVLIDIGKHNVVEQHLLMQLENGNIILYVTKSEGLSFQLATK